MAANGAYTRLEDLAARVRAAGFILETDGAGSNWRGCIYPAGDDFADPVIEVTGTTRLRAQLLACREFINQRNEP